MEKDENGARAKEVSEETVCFVSETTFVNEACPVSIVVENDDDKGVALPVDENESRTAEPLGNRVFSGYASELSMLPDSPSTGVVLETWMGSAQ